MGLDMFARTIPKSLAPDKPVDFEVDKELTSEICYWRKHPDLHGWMEKLYRSKGGAAESFNLVNVVVDETDIEDLESELMAHNLPKTTGFFFGKSQPEHIEETKEFIEAARKAHREGLIVFYRSWW